jgi:hypothetical protein
MGGRYSFTYTSDNATDVEMLLELAEAITAQDDENALEVVTGNLPNTLFILLREIFPFDLDDTEWAALEERMQIHRYEWLRLFQEVRYVEKSMRQATRRRRRGNGEAPASRLEARAAIETANQPQSNPTANQILLFARDRIRGLMFLVSQEVTPEIYDKYLGYPDFGSTQVMEATGLDWPGVLSSVT